MKTCPVCKARCFDDMEVCYGCLHRFRENDSVASSSSEEMQWKPEDPFQGERESFEPQHQQASDSLPAVLPAFDGPLAAVPAESSEERVLGSRVREEVLSLDGAGYRLMVDVRLAPLGEPPRTERRGTPRKEGKEEAHPGCRAGGSAVRSASSHQKRRSGAKQQRKAASHRRQSVQADSKNGSGIPDGHGSRRTHAS